MRHRILILAAALALGCSSAGTTRTEAESSPPGTNDVTTGDQRVAGSPVEVRVGLRDPDADRMIGVGDARPRATLFLYLAQVDADRCPDVSVYFETDSAQLSDEAKGSLETLAQCFREQDVATVEIAGHADPRASEEYNHELGMRRAQSVASYLRDAGVEDPQVEVVSHGEQEARWRLYWPADRRVDVDSEPDA